MADPEGVRGPLSQDYFFLMCNLKKKKNQVKVAITQNYVKNSVSMKSLFKFIVEQNKSYFLHNYQKFSIKSYFVAIY